MMELPAIVDFARNFAVMVRINGPDPRGLKMRNHAFHHYHSGKTTLSASGMLLPRNLRSVLNLDDGGSSANGGAIVVTVASIVEPFLSQKSKLAVASNQGIPELIPGAEIDVMAEVEGGAERHLPTSDSGHTKWFGARVLRLVDIHASSAAIQSLIDSSSGSSEHSWEVGWPLAAHIESPQRRMDATQTQEKSDITSSTESHRALLGQEAGNVNLKATAAARIAFVQIPTLLDKDLPDVMISPVNKRGDILLSMGSPFGILSPMHFYNSISVGSVTNCYPPMSSDSSLLMADIRCLPGMEGGPIFGQHACLIGILNRPLRQTGGAEIQVVIPWKTIERACNELSQSVPQKVEGAEHYMSDPSDARYSMINCIQKLPVSYCSSPLPVEQIMTSVCLITLDNGVWASGVLLNKQGLVLTNAHLLEPWRFGRTTIQSGPDETTKKLFTFLEDESRDVVKSHALQPLDHLQKGHWSHQIHHSGIRVRVDYVNSWTWCGAKVIYVSKGPLDISLLQLESVPHQICPITVDLCCPSTGSQAFVIGHGLLGPRCDLFPSISSGVVSKVVKANKTVPHLPISHENSAGEVPVMLETTASVHPGGSGGAVVNSSGHLIGLVTSNAKHGGGTVIPHMNFSIPSAAMEPVFKYAEDMQNTSLLKQLDLPNKELASVWAMMPPISPERDPAPPGLDDLPVKEKEKQVKGSQFANFINQRQELLKKSHLHKTAEDLSRDTIPSKL